MNTNIHGIILLFIAAIEFVFAFYMFFRKQKSAISVSFGLFILSVGFWALGLALFRGLMNNSYAFIASRTTYISAAFIASTFVYFSLVYPFKTRDLNAGDILLIVSPGIITFFFIFFSDLLIKEYVMEEWGRSAIVGPAYHFYGIFFLVYWLWGFVNLFKKYRATDGIHRLQMKLALWGIIISFALGSFFALFQPWFQNYRYTHYGPESSVIFLAFTAYIIWKK